ncbi:MULTISPECIES: alpha/beta fold hydrolase [Paenibacillus]|uniref:alpha/beta fold hydrolase n=1 Tax=Paenibacillus TaxID=44249 RepID=UPI0022B8A26D|nr:alpha/beta fold hydrolase [Paenibacillus caseinilyticus]MCZ8522308.1 alpha/beta fold hydrolase [Paenibacillus caseinilyticus]
MMKRSLVPAALSLILAAQLFSLPALAAESLPSSGGDEPATDAKNSPTFQGKVDIGGYGLYISVRGARRANLPTVVFENGYGDASGIWDAAASELSKVTRVVTYDRAHIGASDAPPEASYSAMDAANRLHTLLERAGVSGPLVLVGHSMGGLYIRQYARLYPGSVKGLVFVDASHEHMEDVLFAEYDAQTRVEIVEDDLVTSGGLEGHYYPDVDNTYRQIDQGRQADFLRGLPITVLSGGNHGYPDVFTDGEARWAQLQRSLASLSNDSVHITDPGSGHYLHTENPGLVVSSVIALFSRTR